MTEQEEKELQEVWQEALHHIESNTCYSDITMNLWFRDLKLTMITESSVVLVAPSDFKRNIVRGDRHRGEIERALSSVLGYPVTADIRSDETQNAALQSISPDREQIQKEKEQALSDMLNKNAASEPKTEEKKADPFSFLMENAGSLTERQAQDIARAKARLDAALRGEVFDPSSFPEPVKEKKPPEAPVYPTVPVAPPSPTAGIKPNLPSDHDIQTADVFATVGNTKIVNYADVYKLTSFEYTFETFVVGSSNEFAHSACIAAASDPGGAANPLLLYGPSGLGKTHLLYAITDKIQKEKPDKKVIYVKGEDFTNQLIDAISKNITAQFREKYRQADVLLIDDIQFIAGKVSTQEEFFHTFNELYENHKQIIMASDRPPRDMKTLEERLRTRFDSALNADIQPPDLELRMAIIKSKAKAVGLELPQNVVSFLGENLKSNVRQLEGAVKKIAAKSFLSGAKVTEDLAIRCISDMMPGPEPMSVMIDRIMVLISRKYGISQEALKSKRRSSEIVNARNIAIHLIRTLTDMSLPAIGKVFGRDHSTIMNSLDAVEGKIKANPAFEAEIKELIAELQN